MSEFFISYSHNDKVLCEKLVTQIRKVSGLNGVFYDPEIHGGAQWWQLIVNEIRKCTFFVYVVSDKSLTSEWCQKELQEAKKHSKRILPVRISELDPANKDNIPIDLVKDLLEPTQYVDFSEGFDEFSRFWDAINYLKTKPVGTIYLTLSDRWILSNQFEILAALYPDERDYYEKVQEVIDNGYELEYGSISQHIRVDSSSMTAGECKEVSSILNMFRFIKYSCEELPEKSNIDVSQLEFSGFSGNDAEELKYMGYTRFLVEREGNFTNLDRGDDFNSHVPMLPRYRKMIAAWEMSSNQFDLTKEDLIRIGSV